MAHAHLLMLGGLTSVTLFPIALLITVMYLTIDSHTANVVYLLELNFNGYQYLLMIIDTFQIYLMFYT